jgi:4-amino-4-deoxy-L-arabinose transferase-like glycosyltransferase
MFVAGSLLMTIDPPYFFCWGLASAFFALAVLEEKRWAWIACGVAIGVGTLAKYGMLLWPLGMIGFLIADRASRRWLATVWPWLAVGVGLLFLTPPMVWNVKHDWVTFKHVAKQTGASGGVRMLDGNFFELVGSQLGVLGPGVAVILGGAIAFAWRQRLKTPATEVARPRADRAAMLLLWMGLPVFVLCILGSIRSKMQVNWPAAAYFSWMILAGYFLATRMQSLASWRRWRVWVWVAVVFGVAFAPIAHDTSLLYPVVPWFNGVFGKKKNIDVQAIDITYKLKGWRQLGQRVSRELARVREGAFVIGDDYMKTAELAFYVDKQPRTYCVGPYVTDLKDRKRRTQYDVWPDRNLARPELRGKDAIYVGYMNDDIQRAFSSVEELPDEEIFQRGQKVRRFKVYRCRDFNGMQIQEAEGAF